MTAFLALLLAQSPAARTDEYGAPPRCGAPVIRVSPDSKTIAAALHLAGVALWDVASGKRTHHWKMADLTRRSLAFTLEALEKARSEPANELLRDLAKRCPDEAVRKEAKVILGRLGLK